ncbi:SLATT domain-containing protein [Aliivibrio fischeri]|uniref:SLATT domain-containing protein n=1 Tax=Aliivibrio fischeri TaxID=668 RepID=UPI001F272926|nr:SLATT domain-containing protein [Aliivibrio fischeri]MCE7579470.1 SLATT domain-containing protein [Aliivibrio fischeri]MCE7591798.1 SLATT domain-containing protein [Aliivibrio fischeri]
MQSQLKNLYRRSGITKESCFHSARRLDSHNNLSLWALTILAFSLIVISLLTQLYSENGFVVEYSKFLDFSMTALSILALIISIVVAKSNFALRADQFRLQAMEINELRISFRHLVDKEDTPENKEVLYTEKSKAYSSILDRNLVHDQIDFHISNSTGIEGKYYFTKLVVTEYLGYVAVIFLSLSLLCWSTFKTYDSSKGDLEVTDIVESLECSKIEEKPEIDNITVNNNS